MRIGVVKGLAYCSLVHSVLVQVKGVRRSGQIAEKLYTSRECHMILPSLSPQGLSQTVFILWPYICQKKYLQNTKDLSYYSRLFFKGTRFESKIAGLIHIVSV